MNKQAIIEIVHGQLGGTKTKAEEVVQSVFDIISKQLKGGGEVSIAGFGIFATKQRKARTARNPKTGESVQVAAKRVAKFKPAKALKELLA